MATISFRDVLTAPRVVALAGGALAGRMPNAMALTIVPVQLRANAFSWTQVGVAAAIYSLACAVAAPVWGAAVDRGHGRVVVWTTALASGSAFLCLAFAGGSRPAAWATLFVAGLFTPPFEPYLRAAWSRLVDRAHLADAYAFDSAAQQILFVVAPLVVSACAGLWRPELAAGTCALWCVIGAVLFERMPPVETVAGGRSGASPLGSATFRRLAAAALLAGTTLGAMAILAARLHESGRLDAAVGVGGYLALHGLGACFGALALTGLLARHVPGEWARLTSWLAAYALCWLLTAPQLPPVLHVLGFFLAGAAFGPALTCLFGLVNAVTAQAVMSEAFAWIGGVIVVGSAAGSFVAGLIADAGPRPGSLVVGALVTAPLVGALAVGMRARQTRPSVEPEVVDARPSA